MIRTHLAVLAMALLLVSACDRAPQPIAATIVATPSPTPTATPSPTPTPTPTFTPTPTSTPAGWETIGDGVQIRSMTGSQGTRSGHVYALRLDPARVDVRLRFDPQQPRHIAEWLDVEKSLPLSPGALRPIAVMNAGFFDRRNQPVGLWVIDDVTYGSGHRLMQGEFRVSGAGLSIRRVSERYLTDGTRILASIESYPFLILPRHVLNPCLQMIYRIERSYRPCSRSREPAERLVVGIDGAGYLMFVLMPSAVFTLDGLGNWLFHSDLNLDSALNLDGGSSAGMLVQAGDQIWGADSGREVPGAILILPKVLGVQSGDSQ